MNEDLGGGVVQVLKERIAGPLSYITISFVTYNWSWFYFLMFSEKSAEVKISSIMRFFPKLSGIGIPVIVGLALPILIPTLSLAFKWATYHIRKFDGIIDYNEKNYLNHYIADKEVELANKNNALETLGASIEELKKQRDSLTKEISNYHVSLEQLRFDDADIRNEIERSKKIKREIETYISEHNIDNESFANALEKLRNKSAQNDLLIMKINQLQNQNDELNKDRDISAGSHNHIVTRSD